MQINLLQLAADGCALKYPTESDWPPTDKSRFTLRDAMQRLKEEVMKTAIFLGTAHDLTNVVLNVSV